MTAAKALPERPSLESLRKQARKLSRARLLSLRDAQLVLAREYGFAGWKDLVAEVARRTGKGLDVAAGEAERAIHDDDTERLKQLLAAHPALVAWRDEEGRTLLGHATESFGDSGDDFREKSFTRLACAEILIDAGAEVDARILENVVRARAHKLLDLLSRKNAVPRRLEYVAALGDLPEIRRLLDESPRPRAELERALKNACRFQRRDVASLLLDRAIELDPATGARIDAGPGRAGLIDHLCRHSQEFASPWETFVMNEILEAIQRDDRAELHRWLEREPHLLGPQAISLQVKMIETAALNDREQAMQALFEHDPAVLRASPPPPSSAIAFALEYCKPRALPLLTRVWSVPNDLPHAAGTGDFARVRGWFTPDGKPNLGDLARHYPANAPHVRRNLRWGAPKVQHVLDVALAWACLNGHLEIAAFLLDHGADVNTDWCSHEPASILHELVWYENYESMQFLIDHGIDTTILDYRWNATAEGWARHAAKNDKLADFLREAARRATPGAASGPGRRGRRARPGSKRPSGRRPR